MRHFAPVVLAVAFVFLARPVVAEIITPSGAIATSEFGLGVITVGSMIDGSGLDGVGSVADQLHDNVNSNMWHSGCADAGIPGGLPDNCEADPFASAPPSEQIVEFELDATYDLGAAMIWQFNEYNPDFGPIAGRGVKSFEMWVSPNLTDPFTMLGTFELAVAAPVAPPGGFSEPAQTLALCDLPGSDLVQRVQFRILTNHAEDASYVGLSEVRFDGTEAGNVELITPSGVSATSEFGLGVIEVGSMIDGSGLDGAGLVEDQLHDNVNSNMWHSGCADAGIPGGLAPDCDTNPFAVAPPNEQIVEFELDTAYDLNEAVIWQFNEYNPDVGPIPGRGVKGLEMLVSPSATDPFTSIGTFDLAAADPQAPPGAFSEPAQRLALCGLPGSSGVQRVQFRILTNQAEDVSYVGLSEVRFTGAPVTGIQLPGDWNQDGLFDVSDVARFLAILFGGGDQTLPCEPDEFGALGNRTQFNFSGDDLVDITDAIAAVRRLFGDGPPHPLGSDCVPIAGCGDSCPQ